MKSNFFIYYFKQALRHSGLMPMVNSINNLRFWIVKKYCAVFNKNPLEHVYNDKFFNIRYHEDILGDTPRILAEAVKSFYNPKSVIDFGCGIGIYLKEFVKLGVEVFGIDGSPAALRNLIIDKNRFLVQDLTEDFALPRRYDCALCFEVAEHIPTDKSRALVKNITKASDVVIFTAAPKGQGGHDHINEQAQQFWIDIFSENGYGFLADGTERLKKILVEKKAIFWLANNILVFQKIH